LLASRSHKTNKNSLRIRPNPALFRPRKGDVIVNDKRLERIWRREGLTVPAWKIIGFRLPPLLA
jgi:hypothetical protein